MSERAAEKVWIVTDYPSGGIRGVFRSQVDAEGLIASIRADHPDLQRSDFSICVHWFSGSSSRPPVRGESAVQKVWIVSDYPRGGIRAVVSSLESAEAEITAIRAEHPDLRRDDFTVQVERVRGGVEKGLNICLDVEDGVHRCSGCGHRWQGLAVESGRMDTGAELCGDCWRTAQPVLHGPPVRGEQETGKRSIVLCPQCKGESLRERHDRGLFPASMAEWCDRCLPAFSPLFGKSAPVRAEAAKQFTVPTVLKMFQNLGHDTDCGACMGIAFTGAAFESHTCRPQPASASPVREAEPLKALESAARRVIGLAGVIRVYGPADRFREAVDALSAALEGAAKQKEGDAHRPLGNQ